MDRRTTNEAQAISSIIVENEYLKAQIIGE
jgi:hypothetical protein